MTTCSRAIAQAITLTAAMLACALVQAAEPADTDRGYSYFLGLGAQQVRYAESSHLQPVKSAVHTASPLLITGALFALNENALVSMHSENTFFPGRNTETWRATGSSFDGVPLTSSTLQTNGFSLAQSTTQLQGHYRLRGATFGIAGVTMRSQSFKRFAFVAGPDNAVNTPSSTTVEESTSEALLNLGVGLESETVRHSANHYGLRASIGVPIWRRVENTSIPLAQFTGTKGFDLEIEGRYSWALFGNTHAGAWAKYTRAQRSSQTQVVGVQTVELPTNRTDSLGLGLEFLWKL